MAESLKSFTDLLVWQKAHRLMLDTYKFAEFFPQDERFSRTSQIKRSSSSTPANIAEGFGRYHYQENIQFCRQARGSLEETKNHILAARDLNHAPEQDCDRLITQCEEVNRLLNGYIRSLYNTKDYRESNDL